VNLKDLARLEANEVTPQTLYAAGIISKLTVPVKLLGTGSVDRAYAVHGVTFSASAKEKIEQAGGKFASE